MRNSGKFLGIQWAGLRTKIVAWSFVPTAIILVAVALVTFIAYRRVTEELVIERDEELTRIMAGQLAMDLTEYSTQLTIVARASNSYMHDPAVVRLGGVLSWASNRLTMFDGGVVILDALGQVVAAEPEGSELMGQNWSRRDYFARAALTLAPVLSDIVADGPQGEDVVVLIVPIVGNRGGFLGATAGMFRMDASLASPFYEAMGNLRISNSASSYLVDGHGRVIYHSDPAHLGEDFSKRLVVQHALAGQAGAVRDRDFDSGYIVAGYAPVSGVSWGLVTEESWATLASSYRGYQQFLIVLLVLGVVIPALVVAVGVRRITTPIRELISAAQEVAMGNFGQAIAAHTGDEIEDLALQFNRMSAHLQESYANLERRVADRTRELAALNAIAAVVSRSLYLDEILNDALDKILEVMQIGAGGIYLLEDAAGTLTLATYQGFDSEFVARNGLLGVSESFLGNVTQTGEPLVVNDIALDPRLAGVVTEEGFHSIASFPLVSRRKVLGALFVVTRDSHELSDQDVGLLTSIGSQIGVAVENAQLYEQAQQLAVLEERQRLARDLHDSVTQALYGATMYAEAAARLLSAGEVGVAADHLRELQDTAQEALQEMRLLIFELRPPVLRDEGLVAAMQARLESVEGRAGLEVAFKVEGTGRLSPEIEEGLYGIAREALNNVLKHGQAGSLFVYLALDGPRVILDIKDDGVGFNPSAVGARGGLGLCGMRERATRLGGTLTIESSPGQGTRIKVEVDR